MAAKQVLGLTLLNPTPIDGVPPQMQRGAPAVENNNLNHGVIDEASAAGGAADASVEFRSEMAALLAFYAARIGAARRSLSGSVADAIVLAILNEQAVALRGLTDRWHAATQKQRDDKPERLQLIAHRRGNDSKFSRS